VRALSVYAPTADDLDGRTHVLDGTLLPCWSWRSSPGLYSGKHKTTGMLVLVACTLSGHISWISDPVEGRHHDSWCLDDSGLLGAGDAPDFIGDKGFAGKGMLTPFKKPQGGNLLDWQKELGAALLR
jgi:hypothetical protein